MPDTTTEADLAELAIAVYVEELASDKRVLYVGDLESRAPERLARIARSVELVSPQARARGTRRGARVETRRWPTEDDAGRWDLVIVPDLVAAGLSDESQLEQVEGWLADGGVFVAGSAGAGGLAYEALYELLSDAFDSVRMVGQAPFRGYALVDFAPPGPLDVTFDGSLLDGDGERAERFLALCGERDVVLDAYAVVQIPSMETPAPARGADASEPARLESARFESARLESARREAELTERLREQQESLDAANVHAEELERELEAMRADLERVEAELAAKPSGEVLARERDAARRFGARVEQLEDALESARRERDAARRERDAKSAELEAERARGRAAPALDEEYVRLEAQLAESGHELTAVRAELERRAVLVRDLIEELAEASRGGAAPGLETALPSGDGWSTEALHGALEQQLAEAIERAVAAQAESAQLHQQLGEAVERAVASEAQSAQLQFRLDEVRGQLAITEQARAGDLEELRRREAALRGTVRGLNARLAEVTEVFQQTQARVAIVEEDLRAATARADALEREAAEARERVEIELSRAQAIRDAAAHATTLRPADEDAGRAAAVARRIAEREEEPAASSRARGGRTRRRRRSGARRASCARPATRSRRSRSASTGRAAASRCGSPSWCASSTSRAPTPSAR
ncbi:MAG: hypothetical protein KF729_17355 [Sandaracinaceae bacterium]|nr:hypothetical protein [Sandaracinaceae bacterium]